VSPLIPHRRVYDAAGNSSHLLGEREYELPDLYLIPFLDMQRGHGAGRRRGNRRHRLLALQLENRLVFLNLISHLDKNAGDRARISTLAQPRKTNVHEGSSKE
jgi:hypothetical protein